VCKVARITHTGAEGTPSSDHQAPFSVRLQITHKSVDNVENPGAKHA